MGEHYARKRAVPADHILRLPIATTEQIAQDVYERQIEAPIGEWIAQRGAHDRLLYIVLTKGVPLRIEGTRGRNGAVASVDSELTLLYRRLAGRTIPRQGTVQNPYFLGERSIKEAKHFTHEAMDIYLVTRLDGYTVGDVAALIDRSVEAGRAGRFALDERASLVSTPGNRWLERAAATLRELGLGDRVLLESTGTVLRDQADVLGYYSWGSNDPAIKARDLGLKFLPGALVGSFVSTDGRTFKEPPPEWTYGTWENPRSFYSGSPQSLVGDLIRQGVTGASGHVDEPYLDATVRPDVLFPAYVSGFNLAEAYYLAMPYLSWQNIVIGDPLVAPFRQQALTSQDIDRGQDAVTELPALFSQRAVQAYPSKVNPDAVRQLLRARARTTRKDMAGAKDALEQATRIDTSLAAAHLTLASIHELESDFGRAMEGYRRVLALEPNNPIALNNLAYSLAVRTKGGLEEALLLARRANTVAPGNAAILDTLAWVLHLSGDNRAAASASAGAVRLAPGDAQTLFHAAVIDAELGLKERATERLARAAQLDPSLDKTSDVQRLRDKLSALKP